MLTWREQKLRIAKQKRVDENYGLLEGPGSPQRMVAHIDLVRRLGSPIGCDWCGKSIPTGSTFIYYRYSWPPCDRARIHEECRSGFDYVRYIQKAEPIAKTATLDQPDS
jgi:hypothetical protein